jgi:hypothetical protein
MAFINEKPSVLSIFAGIGMLAGVFLLGLVGLDVVSSNTPVLKGAAVEASKGSAFLRRLQYEYMGYITTTALPSSFDSWDSSSFGSSLEPSKSIDSLSSGSLPSLDIRVAWDSILHTTGTTWMFVTTTLILQSLFAIIYYHKIIKNGFGDQTIIGSGGPATGFDSVGKGFEPDIINCLSNKWVFCNGLCCPMVRQAHTNQVSGVCGFWESICCWCCCSWVTLGLGPSCLIVFWRVQIKSLMRRSDNVVEDFCVSCACPQLSVCQMANNVDREMQSEMTGCCAFRNLEGFTHSQYNE